MTRFVRPSTPHLDDVPSDMARRELVQRIRELQDAVADSAVAEFTATAPGTVPASGGGAANYLRADGTWGVPGTSTGTGDVKSTRVIATSGALDGGGDLSADRTHVVKNNGITDTYIRQGGGTSVIGRAAGTTGNVADVAASADGQLLARLAGSLSWIILGLGYFGDGSDTNVHLTAGTTTLSRDMYYDTLTMDDGAIIDTKGYRISVKTALAGPATSVSGGAVIKNNGNPGTDASGTTIGNGGASINFNIGTICPGANNTAGNGGSQGSTGSAGGNAPGGSRWPSNFAPGAGGAGGNGSSSLAGGAVGTATAGTALNGTQQGDIFKALNALINFGAGTPIAIAGGGNGGGGAGSAAAAGAAGGGAGSGGGYVSLAAKTITNPSNVFLQADGGKGGKGVTATGSSGGGGGGGGGYVACVVGYGTLPNMSVAGGTGGAGGTGAQNGHDGGSGQTLGFVLVG